MSKQYIVMKFEDGEITDNLVWNCDNQTVIFPSVEAAIGGIEDDEDDECSDYKIFELIEVPR